MDRGARGGAEPGFGPGSEPIEAFGQKADSRLQRAEAKRRLILELVRQRPDCRLADICRALGMRPTAARHHLHMLMRAGLLERAPDGFEVHETDPWQQRFARDWKLRRVAAFIAKPGEQTRAALVREFGNPEPSAINALANAGLIQVRKDGRRVSYVAEPGLRNALAAATPAPSTRTEDRLLGTVNRQGQLTLPREVMAALEIHDGDIVHVDVKRVARPGRAARS